MQLDEGYEFGLGAFTTLAVEAGKPILLEAHVKRLQDSLDFLKIDYQVSKAWIREYIEENKLRRAAVKVMVSAENQIITSRKNPYTLQDYQRGRRVHICQTRRNEHSPFTYHKSLNCGENILEKRASLQQGYDEPIFLNTQGAISEGATTNIFFVKQGQIYTPQIACGLLPGIIRSYVMEKVAVKEAIIYPKDILEFDQCFLTNALMGIMPVKQFENKLFTVHEVAQKLQEEYGKKYSLELPTYEK